MRYSLDVYLVISDIIWLSIYYISSNKSYIVLNTLRFKASPAGVHVQPPDDITPRDSDHACDDVSAVAMFLFQSVSILYKNYWFRPLSLSIIYNILIINW